MATTASDNLKKILVGVCLCAAAGVGQFFLSGSSPARVDENPDSREAAVTLTKAKRLTQTPAPRFTLTTTFIMPAYGWMRATEDILFPWCTPDYRRLYSNNGDWVATQCINYSMGVYNIKDLNNKFYFTYRDVYGLDNQDGSRYGFLKPIHFSESDDYLYFSPYEVGDGGCPAYGWYYALYKLNLKTGAISNQVSPEEHTGFNFAFSKDDKYLAYLYSNLSLPNLQIQDLKNNIQTVIPIDGAYSAAGAMIWSPDNDQLIFSTRSGEDCYDMDYYVVSMDLKNFDQKVIIQSKELAIIPVRWVDDEHILVEANSIKENSDTKYSILNINTGKLEPESHPEAIPDKKPG